MTTWIKYCSCYCTMNSNFIVFDTHYYTGNPNICIGTVAVLWATKNSNATGTIFELKFVIGNQIIRITTMIVLLATEKSYATGTTFDLKNAWFSIRLVQKQSKSKEEMLTIALFKFFHILMKTFLWFMLCLFYFGFVKKVIVKSSWVLYNLGLLTHFPPWSIFGLGGINTFWVQKVKQKKLLKFTKILNYIKSSCIIFCTNLC